MKKDLAVPVSIGIILLSVVIATIIVVAKNSSGTEDAKNTESVSTGENVKAAAASDAAVVDTPMLTMGVGEKCRLNGLGGGTGSTVSCDRPEVAAVDSETGEMTAKAPGYAIVTVNSAGNQKKYYVTVKKEPAKVKFCCDSVNLQLGEEADFTLEPVSGEEGFAVASYSCGDSGGVISVSEDGVVKAEAEGTAVLSGSAYNGKSAEVKITVLNNTGFTEKKTVADTVLQKQAGWNYPAVTEVPSGSSVSCYGKSGDGRWIKVKYDNSYGWLYNKAFEDVKNYSDYTVETLPVMADDLLFDLGTDKRDIFDFVYKISYDTNGDDTVEKLCVEYFQRERGSCFHHAAMLCYLYNRCGYETLKVNGISALDGESEHSWCLSKTDNGWKHVDAQYFTIRDADDQFFIDDYSEFFNWDKKAFPAMETAG